MQATTSPLDSNALAAFNNFKKKLEKVALNHIDEISLLVECDASEVALSATFNQAGRPETFMTRMLHGS